jgi:hypothetical protein
MLFFQFVDHQLLEIKLLLCLLTKQEIFKYIYLLQCEDVTFLTMEFLGVAKHVNSIIITNLMNKGGLRLAWTLFFLQKEYTWQNHYLYTKYFFIIQAG